MSQQYPSTETEESREGEAAHEIAATIIKSATTGNTFSVDKFINNPTTNGVICDEDMCYGARMYADDVINQLREFGIFGGPNLGIEQRIDIPSIHDECFGTPDNFIFARNQGVIKIWDFKYGYEVVEVFDNYQLISYLTGLIDLYQINGHDAQFINFEFRIVQPRAFHRLGPIRVWKGKLSDIRANINILRENAHIALSDRATFRTGNQCHHCTGRHACPAALRAGMRLFEVSTDPVPLELDNKSLGVQLAIVQRARKQLEYLESGYMEQIANLIRSGKSVPGWIAEQGVGRETWSQPASEIIALGKLLGVDLSKPDNVVTPNQAVKLGIDESVIKAYSHKPITGIKIVPDNGSKAKQYFEEIKS